MVTQPAPDHPYVFVSYASADSARVEPLVAALQRAGVPVWLDRSAIEGGENYAMEIAAGIEHCAALVLMSSAASLASRNVRQEIALGWKYERPYVPLLLEPVTIPKEIEYWLEAAQWIEVLDAPEAAWLPRLLAALAPLGIAPRTEAGQATLAGRERELALLREHLVSAAGGQGSLVLIGGEAGIGKTTLAEAACREAAQRGAVVLTGRCFDLAETPPYGPWLYLFERYPAGGNLPPLPAVFAEPGRIGEITSQAALFRQVLDFIKAVAMIRPLVLLLDDYHWADPASLDLLRYLAQSVAALPVVLLVTYRSDELTRRHPLYQLLPLLVREAGAARLDVRRLDDDAVRALITERCGLAEADTARLAAYLQARAEGNALFLGELLRSLEEASVLRHEGDAWRLGELTQASVPPLLRQVIDGRLARLDEESQRLLAVAAIIGHEVPLAVWATVGEVGEDALLDTVEAGARHGRVSSISMRRYASPPPLVMRPSLLPLGTVAASACSSRTKRMTQLSGTCPPGPTHSKPSCPSRWSDWTSVPMSMAHQPSSIRAGCSSGCSPPAATSPRRWRWARRRARGYRVTRPWGI